MVSCETELFPFMMLLQSPVMRERPLIWTILHYMDDETTILMLIILFYKFVIFFLFFKTWVKWAGSGMESGRSDQSPDPLEGKDHQRLEKVTMIWMSVIFKFLECHWVTCQWPTWTPIWWLTLTAIMWQILVTYLDSHLVTRLWWLIPWLPQDFSATRSSAFTTGASSCLSSLPSMPIPNWRSNTEDYQIINPGSLRIINIEDHLPKTRLLMNSSREVVKKAKPEEEWFNVIMMMDCQPAGECLGESVTTSLHHTIIFLGKTFHLGGNWVKSLNHLLNIYHDTMIYNIYLRDHDIMIYISHNNLSQKNLPPWWNNGSRQTNY